MGKENRRDRTQNLQSLLRNLEHIIPQLPKFATVAEFLNVEWGDVELETVKLRDEVASMLETNKDTPIYVDDITDICDARDALIGQFTDIYERVIRLADVPYDSVKSLIKQAVPKFTPQQQEKMVYQQTSVVDKPETVDE